MVTRSLLTKSEFIWYFWFLIFSLNFNSIDRKFEKKLNLINMQKEENWKFNGNLGELWKIGSGLPVTKNIQTSLTYLPLFVFHFHSIQFPFNFYSISIQFPINFYSIFIQFSININAILMQFSRNFYEIFMQIWIKEEQADNLFWLWCFFDPEIQLNLTKNCAFLNDLVIMSKSLTMDFSTMCDLWAPLQRCFLWSYAHIKINLSTNNCWFWWDSSWFLFIFI